MKGINNFKVISPLIYFILLFIAAPAFAATIESPLVGVWKYHNKNSRGLFDNPIINFKRDGSLIFSMPDRSHNPDRPEMFGNAQYDYKYFTTINNFKGYYQLIKGEKKFTFSLVNRRFANSRNLPGAQHELVNYVNEPLNYQFNITNEGEFVMLTSASDNRNDIIGEHGIYTRITDEELVRYNKLLRQFGIKDLQYDVEQKLIAQAKKIKWRTSKLIGARNIGLTTDAYINLRGKEIQLRYTRKPHELTKIYKGDTIVWKPIDPRNDPDSELFQQGPGKMIEVEMDLKRVKKASADNLKTINETLHPREKQYLEEVATKAGCAFENHKISAKKFDQRHDLYTVNCKAGPMKIKCSSVDGQWVGNVICRPLK